MSGVCRFSIKQVIGAACRYFAQFTKATACATRVNISLSDNVPAVVEYRLSPPGEKEDDEADDGDGEDLGFVRYYLAPKIEDDAE